MKRPLEIHPTVPDGELATRRIPTVTELVRRIQSSLEGEFGDTWVEGEISGLKRYSSGHQYFSLKDEGAIISCVIYEGAPASRTRIADGDQVRLFGRVTVFVKRGQLQLVVRRVELSGAGALQAKFEELKRRLQAEGLFDPARKRPLPKLPRSIGLVTSAQGAAVRDMIQILSRRAPYVRIFLCPVLVQGEGAAREIAAAVGKFSEPERSGFPSVDLVIIGRGGGSIEDLWAFNEEIVARAVAACRIPTISAVGHEIDFTICDFVADLRAPTPSAAAELAAPDRAELLSRLHQLAFALRRETMRHLGAADAALRGIRSSSGMAAASRRLAEAMQSLDYCAELLRLNLTRRICEIDRRLGEARRALDRLRPCEVLRRLEERLDAVARQLRQTASGVVEDLQPGLNALAAKVRLLTANALDRRDLAIKALWDQVRILGYESTLARGYSITRFAGEERILRNPSDAPPGTRIETLLSGGKVLSETLSETD